MPYSGRRHGQRQLSEEAQRHQSVKQEHLKTIRLSLAALGDERQNDYSDWFQPHVDALQSHQRQTKVYCNDQFLDWCQGKSNEARSQFTRLGYVPEGRGSDVERRLRGRQLLASRHDEREVETNRQFSKHRVVIGPVINLLNGKPVNIITACAPNMMSPGSHEFKFFVSRSLGQYVLRRERYRAACESLANLICQSVKTHGMQSLLMPDFGLGVYAKHLEPQSKKAAREIMYAAFLKASREAGIRLRWCLWDKDKSYQDNLTFSEEWLGKAAGPKDHMSFFGGDYVHELQHLLENEVALNPGSNRTVGGMYVQIDATTLEEQIAQFTTLLWTQSTTLNPHLVDQFSDDQLIKVGAISLGDNRHHSATLLDRWLPRVAWLLVIGGSAAVGLLVALGEVASSASPILSFLSLLGIKAGASGLLGSTAVIAFAASATLLLPSLVVFLAMKWVEEGVLAKRNNPQASQHIRHGLRMGRRYVGLGVGIALGLAFTAVAWYVVVPLLVGLPLLMMAVHAVKSHLFESRNARTGIKEGAPGAEGVLPGDHEGGVAPNHMPKPRRPGRGHKRRQSISDDRGLFGGTPEAGQSCSNRGSAGSATGDDDSPGKGPDVS